MLRHYAVVSPPVRDIYPPYEEECCCDIFLAENAADAKRQALKSKYFKLWIDEARSDNKNALWGLSARLCLCPHNVCFECQDCGECLAEAEMLEYEASKCDRIDMPKA